MAIAAGDWDEVLLCQWIEGWRTGDADAQKKVAEILWKRLYEKVVHTLMAGKGVDRKTAEQDAADGFYRMLEELDRKLNGGMLLTVLSGISSTLAAQRSR